MEPRKHQAVNVAEGQSLRGFAPQHVELMSKDKDLGLQRSPRPERSDQGAPDQLAKIAHRERVSADSRRPVSRFGFAVGTTANRAERPSGNYWTNSRSGLANPSSQITELPRCLGVSSPRRKRRMCKKERAWGGRRI